MVKFVVTKNRRYWWPIKVRMPSEDKSRAGNIDEFRFKALFEAIDQDEAKEITERVAKLAEEERVDQMNALLHRQVVGWDDDILDEDKNPVPFDTDTFTEILKDPWVLKAFWVAWTESMSGDSARKGN